MLELRDEYVELGTMIGSICCGDVGIFVDSEDLENALWRMLGAPRS